MIIGGICASPDAHLQGHVLLSGAVDCTQRPPLCLEHGRQIGEVVQLMYAGSDLHCLCEVDDEEAAAGRDFFSIAGRSLAREQHGNFWHVSKFRATEISLVRVPQNDRCLVLTRKPSSPFRAMQKARVREIDLFKQAFETLKAGLQEVARHVEAVR